MLVFAMWRVEVDPDHEGFLVSRRMCACTLAEVRR